MIKRANLLLSKAGPVRLDETALSQMANFNEAELRSQAFIRAAKERKSRLVTLEERIKSYETQS